MALAIGTAAVDITPPPGLDIAGNLWATQSRGTRDPLRCKALVLDDGDTRAALVALDLLGIDRPDVLRARELIEARTGIRAAHVMLACSHTHQGPATATTSATSSPMAYMEDLPRRIADAVMAALQDLAPTRLGFGQAEQRTVGHYRRAKLANGRVRNTWLLTPDADVVGPAGDIDPSLPILAFRAGDEWRALVANFACHATCAGDGRWSANYPGYFATNLADALGLGSDRVIYTSGAAANTNPRVTDALEFGKLLAEAVPPVLPGLEWRDGATLRVRERAITLPPRQIDHFPFALIDEVYGPRFNQLNFARVVKYYANEYAKLIERGPIPVETALQVLALDDIALLAVPGELFVELGREIQQRSPFAHTLIVTHANDRIGYIPHRAAFAEGGYETIFASQSCLAPEAGALLVDAAVALLRETAGERPSQDRRNATG